MFELVQITNIDIIPLNMLSEFKFKISLLYKFFIIIVTLFM